ncbi:na+/H+ antiporter family protein, partial [Vibrio parahaemolyticus V-223/04]
ASC